MKTLKCKQNKINNKLALIVSLVLFLSLNNTVFSEEKPLNTIGEPQLNDSTPFVIKDDKEQDEQIEGERIEEEVEIDETTVELDEESTPKLDNPETSPFTIGTPANKPKKSDQMTTKDITPEKAEPQVEELSGAEDPSQSNMVGDPNNKLGLAYPYMQLEKSKEYLKNKDITNAKAIVKPMTEWLTELTEYHIQLFKKLNNIETAKNQAQVEKRIALDSALLRDKAYYQYALIHLAENNEKEAVKYFIEVIKSQPKTELGMKSYEILQQIGFTEKIRLVH